MALDLTQTTPRSPFETLEGIAWLPRLIDKVLAEQAGTLGDYDPFPGHGDKRFLEHFKLDAKALREVIVSGESEREIVQWVKNQPGCSPDTITDWRDHQVRSPQPLLFRILVVLFRQSVKAKLRATYPGVPLARLQSFSQILALSEGHPVLGL